MKLLKLPGGLAERANYRYVMPALVFVLLFGAAGTIYFITSHAASPTTGAPQPFTITEFPALNSSRNSLDEPIGITSGPDGNLWFAGNDPVGSFGSISGTGSIGKITPDGTITDYPVPTNEPYVFGITNGPDGNLWFTENQANKVGKISPSSGNVTEYPVPTHDRYTPAGITNGPDGNIWMTEYDYFNTQVRNIDKITPSGVITQYPLPTNQEGSVWITSGPDGNLWFTLNNRKIGKITTSGNITEYPLPNPGNSQLGAITTGPDGNLWFTEQLGSSGISDGIGKITTTGVITEYPLPLNSEPEGITSGPNGNVWFTELNGNNIGEITPSGIITEYPISTPNSQPFSITTGPDGNIWFTESAGEKIGRLNLPSTSPPTLGSGTTTVVKSKVTVVKPKQPSKTIPKTPVKVLTRPPVPPGPARKPLVHVKTSFTPKVQSQPSYCPDYDFLGARGSGQNKKKYPDKSIYSSDNYFGMGDTVWNVYDNIKRDSKYSSKKVEYFGVQYPAVSISQTGYHSGSNFAGAFHHDTSTGYYWQSEAQGADWVLGHMNWRHNQMHCTKTKYILAGYSQGAQVIADAIQNLGPSYFTPYVKGWKLNHLDAGYRSLVAGVALFGDPYFNPKSDWDSGTFSPNHYGSLGDFTYRKDAPAVYEGVVYSYCHLRDEVCGLYKPYHIWGLGDHRFIDETFTRKSAHDKYVIDGQTCQAYQNLKHLLGVDRILCSKNIFNTT